MPKLDRPYVTELIRRDARFRGDVRKVAELTGIPYGTLRNAVGSTGDPMRYSRVSLLAEALKVKAEAIMAATGIPDPPPKQPQNEPKAPPRRKDDDQRKTGPKRDSGSLRGAA